VLHRLPAAGLPLIRVWEAVGAVAHAGLAAGLGLVILPLTLGFAPIACLALHGALSAAVC
jgi:hypothetical protein